MRTLFLTVTSVVFLHNPVLAGRVSNCAPQPVCRTAPATVQCRTILPYHIALQRAEVADQLEVQTQEQTSEIEALKAELLAVQQERDSIRKQAEQERAIALEASKQAKVQLKKVRLALKKSQDARKSAEVAREDAVKKLTTVTKTLEQTQKNLLNAEESSKKSEQDLDDLKREHEVTIAQVETLKVELADMKAKLDQADKDAPQKAPKPVETQPAKTEDPVKIEDESESDN